MSIRYIARKTAPAQFQSANDRDEFLKKQIQDLESHVTTESRTLETKNNEIKNMESNIQKLEDGLEAKQKLLVQQKKILFSSVAKWNVLVESVIC